MKMLIAGGTGFLGRYLAKSLLAGGHQVFILTRGLRAFEGVHTLQWDAKTTSGWGDIVNDMDVVIHLAGKSLASWPWTASVKRAFYDSRILPGLALAEAVQKATHRPRIFIQQSGINHYGLAGGIADESTPPGEDFLAQLTVEWEKATESIEKLDVRRIILRSAVIIGKGGGLMPLMALPTQLFFGGPLGSGRQAMPWIHIDDWVRAVEYLIDREDARGVYNFIAPTPTSNSDFTRILAEVLRRPCWLRMPAFPIRSFLGQMSVLILEGRFALPERLVESGYRFQYAEPREAFLDLFGK